MTLLIKFLKIYLSKFLKRSGPKGHLELFKVKVFLAGAKTVVLL